MPRTLIIAEAGVNHNGSMELARQLIDAAVDAGVDLVKFQTFKTEKVIAKSAPKAVYQQTNTGDAAQSQYDMVKPLELSEVQHHELAAYCTEKGIQFWSTAFDHESIDLLKRMGITLGKIPSGEVTNLPYLKAMAYAFPELIVSTGMCTLEDIEVALYVLKQAGAQDDKITLLHCTTEYPAPLPDVNLKAMKTMADHFGLPVGYSDHTEGIAIPTAAVALGATIIEKHFTLDRNLPGPDHKASLEPAELKAMVQSIRAVEMAMGTPEKRPSSAEMANRLVARKSIAAARNLEVGKIISEEDLMMLRPGTGISPMNLYQVVGKRTECYIQAGELLKPEDYA